MKKLLLLLSVTCLGFASCSETLDAEEKKLEEIKKKFDFSEVDVENIQGLQEEEKFSTPESTVFTGTIDDCAWIGVFDNQSGSLHCQYTDEDHPTSYFAYGEEHKYEVGEVLGAYFKDSQLIFVIQYAESKDSDEGRLDLVSVSWNDAPYRYTINEKFSIKNVDAIAGIKLTTSVMCIIINDIRPITLMYDLDDKNVILCIQEGSRDGFLYDAINQKIKDDKDIQNPYSLIFSLTNKLYFWQIYVDLSLYIGAPKITIHGFQCKYNDYILTEKNIDIFEHYYGDSSKAPRYSYEYKTRADNHVNVIFTRTEYDGTITQKTVDVRVDGDELKVEVQ